MKIFYIFILTFSAQAYSYGPNIKGLELGQSLQHNMHAISNITSSCLEYKKNKEFIIYDRKNRYDQTYKTEVNYTQKKGRFFPPGMSYTVNINNQTYEIELSKAFLECAYDMNGVIWSDFLNQFAKHFDLKIGENHGNSQRYYGENFEVILPRNSIIIRSTIKQPVPEKKAIPQVKF